MTDIAVQAATQDIVVDEVFPHKPETIWNVLTTGALITTFNAAVIFAPGGIPPVTLETFSGLTVGATIALTSMYVNLTVNGTPTAAPAPGTSMLSGGADGGFATAASANLFAAGSTTAAFSVTVSDQNFGAWANQIAIAAIPQANDPTNTRFSLNVSLLGPNGSSTVLESYNNLSVLSTDPMYALTVVNADSNYISLAAPTSPLVLPATAPNVPPGPSGAGLFLTGGADGAVLDPTQDGASGGAFMTALNSDGTGTGGIHLLDRVDAFNILCVPGESQAAVVANLQKYCHDHRAFYIVDPPQSATAAALTTSGPAGSSTGSLTGQYSNSSAYYFPWVYAPDPLVGGRPSLFPPCGFIAGIYASTDSERGIWKAPAGIDASLTGVTGLQYTLTDLENGNLNTQGINCLREFKVYGDVIWGARTLQGSDSAGSQWKYVPIRRLALFIESSLLEGTQWVVFEPNDQGLWGQIRLNIGAFMQDLFLQGAFQGSTPQQAFFVKCDADNNPQSSIDLGIVNILVGFAPLYPAEFVVIQIQQMAGQLAS